MTNEEIVNWYKETTKELGIDLVTLFKALRRGVSIFVRNNVDNTIVELPVKFAARKLCNGEIFINSVVCFAILKVADYGKQWALTREELEDEINKV